MQFSTTTDRTSVFDAVQKDMERQGFRITGQDRQRPWGGFFYIDESQAKEFAEKFFPNLSAEAFSEGQKLSPKILLVAPNQRLSWQYHYRRAELWRVIGGKAAIITSETDKQHDMRLIPMDTVIHLHQGERHRLIGLDEWGVIAEIWQHTDPEHPSDEDDIVRVQDDFGR